ncbi:MAG TPA: glycoside hydrolase family 13 protein, partial [Rhodothermales bacterium]|nr:glycoside hydrolase family 13 protein [Rhodothermales bacterium]
MRRTLTLAFLVLLPLAVGAQPRGASHPAPDVPEWAKGAVWYQIFPERFRNGDPTNDPTPESIRGSWPYVTVPGWRPAAWTSDWYAQSDWERASGLPLYTTVQLRRYGGDLAGIIEKLDYLDSLGVTALYLNPLFPSPSLHKYHPSNYHHVDEHFGPNPAGDRALAAREDPLRPETWVWTEADRMFVRLIDGAHRRGIRVILDGVFNHMGLRAFTYESLLREGQRSPYRDWFTVQRWDDPATPDTNELAVQGWMGLRDLPELREDDNGLLPPIRDYVLASVRRWMDPNGDGDPSDGLDGWRLDVAEMVSLKFWQRFRQEVRAINPDAYIVGEVWWEDWPRYQMFMAAPWLQGDAFDAVMNYRWARASRRFFLGSDLNPGERYGPTRFARELDSLRADYPPEVNYVLMNLYDSHDTDRLASQVVNTPSRFDHRIGVSDNRDYRIRRPNAEEWQTMRLMLVHQFTYVGAPSIYYGSEAGMWGADDPDERKPMVWPDLRYAPEASDPFGRPRTPDPVAYDHDLAAFFRTLAHLRTSTPALTHGSVRTLVADDAQRVFAYERRLGEQVVVVAFHLGAGTHEVLLPFETALPTAGHTAPRTLEGRPAREALTGRTAT